MQHQKNTLYDPEEEGMDLFQRIKKSYSTFAMLFYLHYKDCTLVLSYDIIILTFSRSLNKIVIISCSHQA